MSIYAGNSEQFRIAAAPGVMAVVCAAATVCAAAVASFAVSIADLGLAYAAGWPGPIALYPPLLAAQNGLMFSSPPLAPSYMLAPLAVPAISALLAFGALFFWPTEQSLATRLFALIVPTAVAVVGVAAPALNRDLVKGAAEITATSPMLWAAGLCAVAILIVALAERRALSLLANLYELRETSQRLGSWILRVPIGLMLVAMFCLANNYLEGVYAAAGALVVSLIVTVLTAPQHRYEQLAKPMMREAAIILPVIALIVAALMIFLFGMQAAGLRPRAAVLSLDQGFRLEPLRLVQPAGRIDSPYATPAASPSPTPEEKIRMKWSK